MADFIRTPKPHPVTRWSQSPSGENAAIRCRIVKILETVPGARFTVTATAQAAISSTTGGGEERRYGLVAPNTLLDYNDESQANIDTYVFISDPAGFADGEEPYLIT